MTTRQVASEFGWQSGSESDDDGADRCAGIEDEAGEEGSRTVWPFSVSGITRWLYSLLGCYQPAGEWHVGGLQRPAPVEQLSGPIKRHRLGSPNGGSKQDSASLTRL